jgi:hypothetical protein
MGSGRGSYLIQSNNKKQHKTVIVKYCHNVNVLKVLFYIGGEEGKLGVKRHGRRLR